MSVRSKFLKPFEIIGYFTIVPFFVLFDMCKGGDMVGPNEDVLRGWLELDKTSIDVGFPELRGWRL